MLQTADSAIDIARIRDLEMVVSDPTLHPTVYRLVAFWIRVYRKEFNQEQLRVLIGWAHTLINARVEELYEEWQGLHRDKKVFKSFDVWVKAQVVGYVIPGDFVSVPCGHKHKPVMPCHLATEPGRTFWAAGRSFTLRRSDDREHMAIAKIQ